MRQPPDVFVIAEAGVNHNGDPGLALQLVDVAADSGADAVKFQSFRTAELVTRRAPKAAYQARNTGAGESQFEMLSRLELTADATAALKRRAEERGILFMSTPFDAASADMLADLRVRALKIGSGELTNHPFLRHVASKKLPVLLSTGMATVGDIEAALEALRDGYPDVEVTLLHCTSNYPAGAESANLRALETLRRCFGLPVGYSDHTRGIEVSVAAVALGASVIEKHVTIDRGLPGPDHAASADPDEMNALVRAIRNVSAALGDGIKRPTSAELETARVARRSLVAVQDLEAGTVLDETMISIKRPGTGLSPSLAGTVVGMRLAHAVRGGEPLTWDAFRARSGR